MKNIEMKGVDSNLGKVVLENVKYLKHNLNNVLANSNTTAIKNLLEETDFLLNIINDESKTYREKHYDFNKLTQSWFDVWRSYKNIPEAIDLIRSIDNITNYSTVYSYLFLSLSLINEGKTGEYKSDLEKVVSGYFLLSQIVDVFLNFFSPSELKQICDGARNAISVSNRNVREYFEDGLELSNLVTQLRAYSSLIILRVEEHLHSLNSETEATGFDTQAKVNSTSIPWWEQIAGTFADNSAYDEAMRLGREYRNSLRNNSAEQADL